MLPDRYRWEKKAGADLVIIETIADLYEMKAAILAVKEKLLTTRILYPYIRRKWKNHDGHRSTLQQ